MAPNSTEIRTEQILDLLIRNEVFKPLFLKTQSIEEFKETYYNFNKFNGEFVLRFSERQLDGYYFIDKDNLIIQGLVPTNSYEFLVYAFFATVIIFYKTTIELSLDFLDKLAYQYYIKQGIVSSVKRAILSIIEQENKTRNS